MKKVLIVDDSHEIRETCRNVLTRYNYEVSVAKDANDALQILDATFALVMTDLEMPGKDGLWLVSQVKKNFPNMPVVLMSGNVSVKKFDEINNADISDFIKKPFIIKDILITISRHVK
jgi:DNA-binding NtrC family response regulator